MAYNLPQVPPGPGPGPGSGQRSVSSTARNRSYPNLAPALDRASPTGSFSRNGRLPSGNNSPLAALQPSERPRFVPSVQKGPRSRQRYHTDESGSSPSSNRTSSGTQSDRRSYSMSQHQRVNTRATVPNGRYPSNPYLNRGHRQNPSFNANIIRPEWRDWDDICLSIRGLPSTTTTWDLWSAFGQYGTITYIELDEDNHGTRTGKGRIRFSPPPAKQFWHKLMRINIQGEQAEIDVILLPHREKSLVRSPAGSSYPPRLSLTPRMMEFGVLVHENEIMPMRTINNNTKGEFSLTIDLKPKRLDIAFACYIKDPRRNDPTIQHSSTVGEMEGISEYKAHIPFTHLKKIIFTDIDEHNWSLLIPLSSPPAFFKKRENSGLYSDSRNNWKESDLWNRTVDITYDTSWFKDDPIALPRANQFVDIGRWTTYRITFEKSSLAKWSDMKTALRDFGVKIDHVTVNDFLTVPAQPPKFWDIVDHHISTDVTNANLALLIGTEEIHLPYDVRYQLEVCISHGFLNEVNITAEFLRKLADLSKGRTRRRDRAKDLLMYISEPRVGGSIERSDNFDEKRIYDPMSLFEDKRAMSHYPEISLPEHCQWVRKAVVTPTTIYLSAPAPEPSNRILRKFASYADRFLRIQFTDELSKGRIFPAPESEQNNALFNRVFRTLQNGIRVGGRHFQFLAFGNSQFRENGAYFFCPTEHLTCDNIRSWMGEVNHIRVVAKYAARLGQCFSTTRTPKALPIGQSLKDIPDIERDDWCFTDGVGKIAQGLAQHILKANTRAPPSAFQIRLGGCKGLLVQWPDVPFNEIHLRPSQKKFNSSAKSLEIIKESRFSVATLNKQTINILSCLGVPDSVFTDMLKKQLANYERAMEDPTTAMELLSRYVDQNGITTTIAQMIVDGFMRGQEPFFMAILQVWRAWSMRLLREKARIVVDKGAFVFGCIDETRSLRGHDQSTESSENKDPDTLPQIFLQVPKTGTKPGEPANYTVITGICVVGRNPSLHPGDIRVVEAVDVPALRHLRDVVVFPANGDRDIPSMCSGGDLDGDDFFVIWDPQLIPAEWNYAPMVHEAPKPKELKRDVRVTDLIQFFVRYMKNDSLSTIAHAHLAMSDTLDDGPRDPRCIELAQLHSNAVDYPKTGLEAHLSESLRPRKFPHFMEKAPYKSYRSTKILGQLYDFVTMIDFTPKYDGPFDERILRRYNISDDMLKNARIIKRQYDKAIRQIMNQREIKTEFEVWSTFVLTKPRVGTDYKMQETMGPIVINHRERFRTACIKVAGSRAPEVLYPMIAATYRATWEEVQIALRETQEVDGLGGREIPRRQSTPDAMPLISFPWIFEIELGRIANSKQELELDKIPSVALNSRNNYRGGGSGGDDDDDGDDEYERLVSAGLIGQQLEVEDNGDALDGQDNVSQIGVADATSANITEAAEAESLAQEEIIVLEEDEENGLDVLARLAN
ncbi:RdRP-domain-containing protein [Xylariaceae sp. FL0662B]|nr:RdRP-domain-containing protein [Xylariaceae sp. FL0662B]